MSPVQSFRFHQPAHLRNLSASATPSLSRRAGTARRARDCSPTRAVAGNHVPGRERSGTGGMVPPATQAVVRPGGPDAIPRRSAGQSARPRRTCRERSCPARWARYRRCHGVPGSGQSLACVHPLDHCVHVRSRFGSVSVASGCRPCRMAQAGAASRFPGMGKSPVLTMAVTSGRADLHARSRCLAGSTETRSSASSARTCRRAGGRS
jgi:hypothetical protein